MGLVYPKATDLSHLSASNNGGIGLVAAYNMRVSPDGVLVDISGEGNNGTIGGAVSSEDGMVFNGRDYIQLSDAGALNPVGDFTWCMRIGLSQPVANNARILSNSVSGNGYEIYFNNYGPVLEIRIYTATGIEEKNMMLFPQYDQIYNLVISKSGNVFNIYVDGVLEATETFTVPVLTTANNTFIGSSSLPNNWMKINPLTDLKMYNYAFSEQEAIDYHSQWAKQVSHRQDFSDYGVGSTIG